MKHTSKLLALFFMAALTACSITGQVTMMERGSGKAYTGTIIADRVSKAVMNITLNGVNYVGAFTLAESNDSTTIGSSFGNSLTNTNVTANSNGGRHLTAYGSGYTSGGGTSISHTQAGTRILRGIFTSSDGKGLRCETTATGLGGEGVCVDNNGQTYDMVVTF